MLPIMVGSTDCMNEVPEQEHIGNLELFYSDNMTNIDSEKLEKERPISALSPIFNLLKKILDVEEESEPEHAPALELSKIEESKCNLSVSQTSIVTGLLENKKFEKDQVADYRKLTKPLPSFSDFLSISSKEIPKIFQAQKATILLTVEVNNVFGGVKKTAYFYSFTDNHTYNFEYEGTFVQKVIDEQQPVTFVASKQVYKEVSVKNMVNAGYPKNISNESFYAIRYLPVRTGRDKKVTAVLEV